MSEGTTLLPAVCCLVTPHATAPAPISIKDAGAARSAGISPAGSNSEDRSSRVLQCTQNENETEDRSFTPCARPAPATAAASRSQASSHCTLF